MTLPKLPDKMSDLLAMSIAHLDEAERDSTMEINMGVWAMANVTTGRCGACLAGSVMLKGLNLERPEAWGEDRTPFEFLDGRNGVVDRDLGNKLLALNELRCGCVSQAGIYMGIHGCPVPNRTAGSYDEDSLSWKRDMAQLERELREAGF